MKKPLNIRLELELIEAMKKKAKENDRSLTSEIKHALKAYLESL